MAELLLTPYMRLVVTMLYGFIVLKTCKEECQLTNRKILNIKRYEGINKVNNVDDHYDGKSRKLHTKDDDEHLRDKIA
ncbi:hypothetical protein CHS0354_004820 [Potamilus streckersoni]|uniref:Uncharacterized protein n=1 Tax=Potamilus streckersoni TaxID=2493646 RepID=A0AAE0VSM0_9BIVA|nr:hypothetical protein CHS0354_004820 [Potamilus streckersoni]